MVANIGVINPSNVEATAYISAVAAFAAVVLVVLLFLGRRWCYTAVFHRSKCCDDILAVNPRVQAPCLPIDNAQLDALSKPISYPERIFTFEASDSDDELRLRIQQGPGEDCTEKNIDDIYGQRCAYGYYCNPATKQCQGIDYSIDSNYLRQVVNPKIRYPLKAPEPFAIKE